MIIEVEVVKKNKEDKSLLVNLIKLLGFSTLHESKASKYDPSEKEFHNLFGDSQTANFLSNLHLYEINGLIRSYDVHCKQSTLVLKSTHRFMRIILSIII